MRLALAAGLLIAATIVPVSADAGPVRATPGARDRVAVTARPREGTVVVGKTAARAPSSSQNRGQRHCRRRPCVARAPVRGDLLPPLRPVLSLSLT